MELATALEELNKAKAMIEIVTDDRNQYADRYNQANAENTRLQRALDAEREKVKFGSCEACWNLAWVLCRDDEPNAVPMKCANGTTYWRCDYCWYKQQLATLQAQLRQVEGENELLKSGQRYMALGKERDTLRQLVEEADELYTHYGLLANPGYTGPINIFEWIGKVRAAKDAGKETDNGL